MKEVTIEFRFLAAAALFCSRPKDKRPVFEHILVEAFDGFCNVVATDGKRAIHLSTHGLKDGLTGAPEWSTVLHSSDIARMGKVLGKRSISEAVTVSAYGEGGLPRSRVSREDVSFSSSVDGVKFPNWRMFIPKLNGTEKSGGVISMDAALLADCGKVNAMFASSWNPRQHAIKIRISDDISPAVVEFPAVNGGAVIMPLRTN